MYLRAGGAYSGLHLAGNNNILLDHQKLAAYQHIRGGDSFIRATLKRGTTYTIEVSTAGSGSTGQYNLQIRTL